MCVVGTGTLTSSIGPDSDLLPPTSNASQGGSLSEGSPILANTEKSTSRTAAVALVLAGSIFNSRTYRTDRGGGSQSTAVPANEVLKVAKREIGVHDGLIAGGIADTSYYHLLHGLSRRLDWHWRLSLFHPYRTCGDHQPRMH